MRQRGVEVQLGLGGDVSIPQNMVVAKELSICGSFRFHAEFKLAVQLINSGRVDMAPMVTGAFPLSQARQAFCSSPSSHRGSAGAAAGSAVLV